jgi:hypothetical protein
MGTAVQFGKSDGEWSVTFFDLSHPREPIGDTGALRFRIEGGRAPQIETRGPYPVRVENGILHIQQPDGVLKYSCRFHRDLLQFPAVVRLNERTFNLTFCEVHRVADSERPNIATWTYTWTCSSAPSKEPSGRAVLVAISPRGKEAIPCSYKTEKHHDGPALVFQRRGGDGQQQDRIVWHDSYYGLQLYDSASWKLKHTVGLQKTYQPAEDEIKDLIRAKRKEKPDKPDAGDGK